VSLQTVKHHLTNIFDKVGVHNRLELALFSVHNSLGSDQKVQVVKETDAPFQNSPQYTAAPPAPSKRALG
jgi:hypothetical protein